MKKRIIDNRKKEKYMVDDEYLNGMARICGWKATLVYNSLCRHANKEQTCFPSIKLMADQHGVGRDTILRGIKSLEDRNVIEVGKTRSSKGYWLNNSYTLTDKSEWNYNQVDESDVADQVDVSVTPSRRQRLDQVDESDTKETHTQGNTYKVYTPNGVDFDFSSFKDQLSESKRKIDKIVILYWDKKGFHFENYKQAQTQLKRDLKAAKDLEGYTGKQLSQAMEAVIREAREVGYNWTLETVVKRIADIINI